MHDFKCDMNELFIEQFIDSELDLDESAKMSAHIEICHSCKAVYEELKFIRKVVTEVKNIETLSPIEKEGFYHLIDKSSDKKTIFSKMKLFISGLNQKIIILSASTSFIILSVVFSFMIFNVDKSQNLIIQEIISAHSNNFPDEFRVTADTESDSILAGNKKPKIKMDQKVVRELIKISPVLKGRYTSIAAQPMAKLKLRDENGEGTLLMSSKNDRLKPVFQNGNCLLRTPDGKSCKVTAHHTEGNDIVYWESKDSEFVFVSSNKELHSSMMRLISDNY